MTKHGKKYRAVKERVSKGATYELSEALDFLRQNPTANFDETVEIGLRMGVDPRRSDQSIRSTVALPNGTGKEVRVIVFASGDAAEAAREAGADEVGLEELAEKVEGGWLDFDVAIATPESMRVVGKLGRFLGPRGLMPNPKAGSVTSDTATAVKQFKAGRVEFRMDRHGNITVPFGKRSFEKSALEQNCNAVLDAIVTAKPAAAKGRYIKRATVSNTMGPGLRIKITKKVNV